jgi:alkyl hydroperoxide reductase subunit AhpF
MPQIDGVTERINSGVHNHDHSADVFVDYLIVGTGPAGASLACFLTQQGKHDRLRRMRL